MNVPAGYCYWKWVLRMQMKMFSVVVAGLILLVLGMLFVPAALAQEGQDSPPPDIVMCSATECRYSPVSGILSYDDLELVLGKADEYGTNLVVCDASGCQWSAVTLEELEFVLDQEIQDAEQEEMVFDEDEVDPITTDEKPDVIELEDQELNFTSVVPLPGTWVTYHDPSVMECSMGMTIDVPGSGPDVATLSVSEDGSTLTGLDLDPETANMDMLRTPDGHYRSEMEFSQDGGTMTLVFELFFLDEALGFGFIDGQIEQQGYSCSILRSFVTTLEGAFPELDAAAAE